MSQELSEFITRFKHLLHYCPISGNFTFKVSRGNISEGSIAGSINNGYVQISIDNIHYMGHRLAWLYMYNEWPTPTTDHIDGNRSNNAISNLRVATQSENNQNKLSTNNVTGFRGVYRSGSKFATSIKIDKKDVYLGTYSTPEEASFIYENKAKEIHGAFYKDPEYAYTITNAVPCKQTNTTGYKGVRKSGSKFKAVIKINGINVHLGTYNTPEEAYEAFKSKKLEIGRV